jgi:hypothetical protein
VRCATASDVVSPTSATAGGATVTSGRRTIKHDAWRPYRNTRFVLVRSPGRLKPCRGLILDWRNLHPRRWEAQVIYYDDAAIQPTPSASPG